MTYHRGLINAEVILVEEQQWYFLTHCNEDLTVHIFPKNISPKVNLIVWLEFEDVYFEAVV